MINHNAKLLLTELLHFNIFPMTADDHFYFINILSFIEIFQMCAHGEHFKIYVHNSNLWLPRNSMFIIKYLSPKFCHIV